MQLNHLLCLLGCFAPFVVRDSSSGVSVALVIVSWCFGEGSLLRQVKGKKEKKKTKKKENERKEQ